MDVRLAGITLSHILTEVSGSESHGLIFGKISRLSVQTLEDKSEGQEKITNVIEIRAFEKCPFFERKDGEFVLNLRLLQELQNGKFSAYRLIGWFRIRNSLSLRPSIQDTEINRMLSLWNSANTPLSLLVDSIPLITALFGSSLNSPKTPILNFDYRFFSIGKSFFQPIPIRITSVVGASQTEYKEFSPFLTFSSTMDSLLQSDLKNKQSQSSQSQSSKSVQIISLESIYEQTISTLKKVAKEVHTTHSEIIQLEEDIKKLRTKDKKEEEGFLVLTDTEHESSSPEKYSTGDKRPTRPHSSSTSSHGSSHSTSLSKKR